MCPFDYTAFAVIGKVGIPYSGLTTPVGWLSLVSIITPSDRLKSVPNRCVIVFLVAFLCCHVAFWVFLSL